MSRRGEINHRADHPVPKCPLPQDPGQEEYARDKLGKDPSKHGSYRPVSLRELFICIMVRVLKEKLALHADRLGILS